MVVAVLMLWGDTPEYLCWLLLLAAAPGAIYAKQEEEKSWWDGDGRTSTTASTSKICDAVQSTTTITLPLFSPRRKESDDGIVYRPYTYDAKDWWLLVPDTESWTNLPRMFCWRSLHMTDVVKMTTSSSLKEACEICSVFSRWCRLMPEKLPDGQRLCWACCSEALLPYQVLFWEKYVLAANGIWYYLLLLVKTYLLTSCCFMISITEMNDNNDDGIIRVSIRWFDAVSIKERDGWFGFAGTSSWIETEASLLPIMISLYVKCLGSPACTWFLSW